MNDVETLQKIIEIMQQLEPPARFRILDWLQGLQQNEWNDEIVFGEKEKKK